MIEARAILIDLYDTLAWSEWPSLRALIQEQVGVSESELVRAFVRSRPARSVGAFDGVEGDMAATLREAGVRDDPTLVRRLVELERTFLESGVHLYEDALPTLRELRSRGRKTAVVSNCSHSTRPVVDRLALAAEVDALILSFEIRVAKPDPGIYQAALDALDASPAGAVFIDDQSSYCDGAAALGISTLLIHRENATPDEGIGDPGPHRVIRDLRALLD